jgi:hypothetical protein
MVTGLVLCYLTENQIGMIMDQIAKRRRGRPPKAEGALSNTERQRAFIERQRIITAQRQRDTAELAYALKDALGGHQAAREAFMANYPWHDVRHPAPARPGAPAGR